MIFRYRRGVSLLSFFRIVLIMIVASSCNPSRRAVIDARKGIPADFYRTHSELLGFRLAGTEDPRLIEGVTSWLGVPYRYGGTNHLGMDCSGFVLAVFKNVYGISLPRSTTDMTQDLKRVSRVRIREGDLVFFRTVGRKVSHVGIYLGQYKFIHASTSLGVTVSDMREPYYSQRFVRAGRIRERSVVGRR